MRLESEVHKLHVTEKRFVHGKWRIIKIYCKGELTEIVVNRREDTSID